MSKVYMEVTQDKYELPVAVANSAAELGRIVGVKGDVILSLISHAKASGKPCKYICVEIDDNDDDE